VDFNRGGTPLVEIVTEPDLHDGATAREWLSLLRTTIRQLGVSDVNMDEGSLRCDANISLRPAGTSALGTKTELKNMNSFRFVERGIAAEIERQKSILDGGRKVEQETLHFDPRSGDLTPLRSKEYSHDYRYFPEPDLVPIAPTEEMLASAREALPELPAERRERYAGLGLADAPASSATISSRSLRPRLNWNRLWSPTGLQASSRRRSPTWVTRPSGRRPPTSRRRFRWLAQSESLTAPDASCCASRS
jgi:Asp-tRNA(Asn)/Glu-tRNA(Gln) amidotransferase B subunit